jgi:hypothetical protein
LIQVQRSILQYSIEIKKKVNIQEINQVKDKYGTDGRKKKTICNKLMGETPFETVSGRISPSWTKHSQIEHACGIFSPIWEK